MRQFISLFTPPIYAVRNRIRRRGDVKLTRDLSALFLSLGLMIHTFVVALVVFKRIQKDPETEWLYLQAFVSTSLLSFSVLLLVSSVIGSFYSFFYSHDLPLLLAAPLSNFKLFASRFIRSLVSSTWMFVLVALPAMAALVTVYRHSLWGLFIAFSIILPTILIPSALGSILALLFAVCSPSKKARDMLLFFAVLGVISLFWSYLTPSEKMLLDRSDVKTSFQALYDETSRIPHWLPSQVAATTLTGALLEPSHRLELINVGLLQLITVSLLGINLLLFRWYFRVGYARTIANSITKKTRARVEHSDLLRRYLPFPQQFTALLLKELRIFLRDTAQSLQLILLLMLTFLYLCSFRSLQTVSHTAPIIEHWWRALLLLCNVLLGACIVCAIATRFIYPTISLEGSSYYVLRATPLSVRKFVLYKFFIWLLPALIFSLVLLVSGALAVQAPPLAIFISALLALFLSILIVGLGVGTGAVYHDFEWENANDISCSTGSLMFMFFSFGALLLITFPTGLLVLLTAIPPIQEFIPPLQLYSLIAFTTVATAGLCISMARRSLGAGVLSLLRREGTRPS